ncbi:MAG: YkgJ family cysteine cluster protein, partial [Deltaproteobacteria bacterium]|nr:YkgJ family cysteine cluster protein [Deltaproteobacteria bacterium]
MDIVFTFADGRLAYDCQRCGSRCCQLDGFALPSTELRVLLQHYPTLALFTRATRTADFHALRGVGGGCPLLEEDGQCRAHHQLGYAAKPYVCKIYPANQLYLLGETLLVDLHPDCPLERVEVAGKHALRLEHDVLRETLQSYAPIPQERSAALDAPAGGAEALIAAGCGIRDVMADYAHESVLDLATRLSRAHEGETRTSLEAFAQRLARFLGGEPSSATALQHTSDPDLALALPR